MSFWLSMTSLRPWRTTTWSSASSTRSRPLGSGMLALDAHDVRRQRKHRQRHGRRSNKDGRAFAQCRFDFHRCADERGTFLHAQQTKSAPVSIRLGGVKADAVVLDDQKDLIGSAFEDDFDMSGM